jgi:hypothetical protein
VRLVVPIEPPDAAITILPNGRYDAGTGEILVYVDEGGSIPVTVIAEAQCASDTCEFVLQVEMRLPPAVSCPAAIDTLMCLAEPTTLCFPVEVTGTGVQVNVNPVGEYSAGFVCIPVEAAGDYNIEIIAQGACGTDTCYTDISVTADELPELFLPEPMTFERCPDDTDLICIDGIYATDLESEVTLVMTCGDGEFEAVRVDSGRVCFRPDRFGVHEFCFEALDGCHIVAGSFTVDIVTKEDCEVCVRVEIGDSECTPVGLRTTVPLTIETNDAIAGFDLLLSYDASALTLVGATNEGTHIEEWEYFTYNVNNAACGAACPSGIIRMVGIADVNNGAAHPPVSAYTPNGPLAFLEFQIANDQNLGGQYVPINFVWYDCGDNAFSDVSGSLLYLDLRIFNAEGVLIWDEDDDISFPEASRPFGMGAPDECLVGTDKMQPLRCVEFVNGGVCIIHPDSIDDRGDINLDGLAYTIADVVLFTNYFIHGLSAFTVSIQAQIAATDINADGLALSVADLAYLIRIVVGDAQPYSRPNPYADRLEVTTALEGDHYSITTEAVETIGVAYFVYSLESGMTVGEPRLTAAAAGMDLVYAVENDQLKMLVYDIGSHRIDPGANRIVEIPVSGQGTLTMTRAEIADYNGRAYVTVDKSATLPGGFALSQNYPNPFNPSTNISFDLPVASVWKLTVFNIRGEMVREFTGVGEPGTVEVVWDGTGRDGQPTASGVYLYRLQAGDFAETRKMILLK